MHYKIKDFLVSLQNTDVYEETIYDKKATEKICFVCFDMLKNYIQIHCPKQIKSIELLELAQAV